MNDIKKKRFCITVFSAIFVGLLAQLLGMVNNLHSIDAMITVQGTGAGITSGRWMLDIMNNVVNKIWPMWNLGFFNNALAIIVLALAAYVVVMIFDIEDPWFCALFGGVFLSFPSVCSTFLFPQATVHYAIAVFLSVYSVYLTDKSKWSFIPASLLSAVSIGIYQAYYPMTAVLYMTLLILKSLKKDAKASALLKRAFFYLGTMLLALIEYFIILKLMLFITGAELSGYQGIDSMGKFTLAEIPALIIGPYLSFFKMFLRHSSEAVNTLPVQTALIILALVCGAIIIYLAVRDRKIIFRQGKGILILFLLLYPAAVFGIRIMCFHSEIHSLMIYAAVLFYLLPLVLLKHFSLEAKSEKEKKSFRLLRLLSIAMLLIVILNYALQSNLVYTREMYRREQVQSFCTNLISRVESTPGYREDMEWVCFGNPLEDKGDYFFNEFGDIPFNATGCNSYLVQNSLIYLEEELGYDVNWAPDTMFLPMFNHPETQNMPYYPSDGSIKIVDDILVINFSEVK